MQSTLLDIAALTIFPLLMVYAAVSDVLTMTIANRISIVLVAAFLLMATLAGMPWNVILIDHMACGAAVLVLTFTLFAFGWIGGGDAKLAASTAVWIGWSHLSDYGLFASVLGAGLTLLILKLRTRSLPTFWSAQAWLARLHDKKNGVPYGVALAVSGLFFYPETTLWHSIVGV